MLPVKQTTAVVALSADDTLVGPSVLPAEQMTAVLALFAEGVTPADPLGLCTPGCGLWTLWHPQPQHQQAPLSEAQISRLRQQIRLASLQLPHAGADLAALQQVGTAGALFAETRHQSALHFPLSQNTRAGSTSAASV